jgi:hypothetical protein
MQSDASTFVPLPIAVLVMLGGFLGTYFAIWNLSKANDKPIWKAVSLLIPMSLLSVFSIVWLQSQTREFADYPEPEVESETVNSGAWPTTGETELPMAPEPDSTTSELQKQLDQEDPSPP